MCLGQMTSKDPTKYNFEVGVDISFQPGQFAKTTVLTFKPRIILQNNLKRKVQIRQALPKDKEKYTLSLEPGELCAMHWIIPKHMPIDDPVFKKDHWKRLKFKYVVKL